MRIAMIGTRGVPAAYGGFETAVEEIGRRLVADGHEVVVYCRRTRHGFRGKSYLGMKLVRLPAIHLKVAETLSHSFFSVMHAVFSRKFDAAFVFNSANAPFVPLLKLRRIPVAVHVDGLEWKRAKWNGAGKRYYLFAEKFAVRVADALIADAQGIADYYRETFNVDTEQIAYGAPIQTAPEHDLLSTLGLLPGNYHLVVARFEPENHVALIVDAFKDSTSSLPLIVVGTAPYAAAYTKRIEEAAATDARIRLLGGIWDQALLDQLYANALDYVHGHSVGGTNPSLLRAMGSGVAVLAYNVGFNREVLGPDGLYFAGQSVLTQYFTDAENYRSDFTARGAQLQLRAARKYTWGEVAAKYEDLASRLASPDGSRTTNPRPALPTHAETELRLP